MITKQTKYRQVNGRCQIWVIVLGMTIQQIHNEGCTNMNLNQVECYTYFWRTQRLQEGKGTQRLSMSLGQ